MSGGELSFRKIPAELAQLATILAATFLLGSTFPAGKFLLQHHNPPFLLAALRFLTAPVSIFLATFLLGGARATFAPTLNPRQWATIAAIGLLQTSMCIGCLFLAMQRISPSAAALLLFTNPIWVAALGVFVLGQPLTRNRLAGLGLGILGVSFILAPAAAGKFDAAGYAFGLLSSFGWAGATLLTKKARLPVSSWTLTLWQMLSGSLALFCFSLIAGEPWSLAFQTWTDVPVFAWLAIPGSAGAYGLWSIALRRSRDAGEASAFLFLVPLFATVLSYGLLGSTLTATQLIGGAAICCGLWISTRLAPITGNLLATR